MKPNFFTLPDLSGGNLVSFPCNGSSMSPVINHGDIVVCRETKVTEIKDGEIYAVRNNGSVWVKYVRTIKDADGEIQKLKLSSADYLEHDPFIEVINDFTRVYKVIRRISHF